MWTLLVLCSAVSVWFGLKVKYEEDITRLLPSSASSESGLAFGNLKVKDKIFLQFTSRDSLLDTYALASCVDEFVDSLMVRDSSGGYVDNVLYRIDDDLPVMALDFALSHVPSFVDTSCYAAFDELLEQSAVDSLMSLDCGMVMADETGSVTQMVATDPLSLRNVLASDIKLGTSFKIIDSHLFCADSTVALAFVSPGFTSFDSKDGTALVEELEDEAEEFSRLHPEVEVLFHGAPVRSAGNSRQIKKDLLLTIGISLLIILIVICRAFRTWKFIPLNLVPVAFGTFFALACMYWIKGGMSLMALGVGAIILGVAISYCLHILTHFKYVGDAEKVLEDEAKPVCLGCITTIGAFLGLLFTESELLRDFGMFASIALVASTLFALIFLPHFLKAGDTAKDERIFSLIGRINDLPYDRNKPLLAAVTVLIIVGVAFAGKVTFDSNLKNIGYISDAQARSEALYAEKNAGDASQLYFAAAGQSLDEALNACRPVISVCDSMEEEGLISGFSSMATELFVPEDEQEARIAAWKNYWNSQKPGDGTGSRIDLANRMINKSASENGLDPEMFSSFFSMVSASYAPGSLYEAGILPPGLETTLVEKMEDGRYLVFIPVKVLQANRKTVCDRLTSLPHVIVADPFYYTGDMVSVIRDDFNVTLLISSLFVLIVLLLSFRNIIVSLLAYMPMFFSWYVVEGIMAMAGLQFNLINIIISTFIFGIGVDYSIFVMEGLLTEAKTGRKSLLEWHKTAIFFSAFVLLVVVLALLFASHPAIHSIGTSTLIGMSSTILITYTLEPFLFRLLLKWPYFSRRIRKTE